MCHTRVKFWSSRLCFTINIVDRPTYNNVIAYLGLLDATKDSILWLVADNRLQAMSDKNIGSVSRSRRTQIVKPRTHEIKDWCDMDQLCRASYPPH